MGQKDNKLAYKAKPSINFLLGKAERLGAASYLVTSHLAEAEPLKWSIRKESMSLLSELVTCLYAPESDRTVTNSRIRGRVNAMVLMLQVASKSHIISDTNSQILREEFLALTNALDDTQPPMLDTTLDLSVREVLKDPTGEETKYIEQQKPVAETKQAEVSKGHSLIKDTVKDSIKDTKDNVLENNVRIETVSTPSRKINTEQKEQSSSVWPSTAPARPQETANVAKNIDNSSKPSTLNSSRRESILAFIRRNGRSSIKEIADVIEGCSMKTVQRELAALVDEGVLTRQGERRWSRYNLA